MVNKFKLKDYENINDKDYANRNFHKQTLNNQMKYMVNNSYINITQYFYRLLELELSMHYSYILLE